MKGLTMTLQELIDLDRPTLLTHIEKALSKQESVVFGGYRYQVDDLSLIHISEPTRPY